MIRYNDVLELITVLTDDKNLQCTVKESAKGGLVAGGIAGLGKHKCALVADRNPGETVEILLI